MSEPTRIDGAGRLAVRQAYFRRLQVAHLRPYSWDDVVVGDGNPVFDVVEGEGYAVGNIAAMGRGYGFRKVRRALGVSAFGVNALILPPRYAAPAHFHDRQEETYFVHRGELEIEFGDGSRHLLGPGSAARVDASTVRRLRNRGPDDAVVLVTGGKDGYVGRDGQLSLDDEQERSGHPISA